MQELEEKVFVDLLSAQGRQAKKSFAGMIAEVLDNDFDLADYSPDEAGMHTRGARCTRVTVPCRELVPPCIMVW